MTDVREEFRVRCAVDCWADGALNGQQVCGMWIVVRLLGGPLVVRMSVGFRGCTVLSRVTAFDSFEGEKVAVSGVWLPCPVRLVVGIRFWRLG